MATYVIDAIQRDFDGEVSAVRWGLAKPNVNGWAVAPEPAPVEAVIAALDAGDTVTTRHMVGGGKYVAGQNVCKKILKGGRETIQSVAPSSDAPGLRGVDELPDF
ncbi:carbohydrate isomerase [Bordetella bronchiseptica]|uniref:carbohydrate isomerase n=1 Tax=Bordetella bronchiseptica TaxID=518 RepID=UPI001268B137|nr:carbohydrate isomerase [Bordetella bronchiseptica]